MTNLDIYNTHIEVYPYSKGDLPVIENMYTAQDKFSGNDFPCGYLIDNGKLYIPRGTSISRLEDILGVKAKFINESDPFDEMDNYHAPLYEPRNEIQEESIKFLGDTQHGYHQLSLNIGTGFGKGHPLSTKIPSPDDPRGYKLMGEIKPGDRVFGSQGNPITVTRIFPLGVQDIYRVTFADGRSSMCTYEHLWPVYINHSAKYEVMTLRDIVALKLRDFKNTISVPNFQPSRDGYFWYTEDSIYEQYEKTSAYLRDYNGIDTSSCIKGPIDIISIVLVGQEEAQCIMVDAPDHLYLTEQYIVTHNTFCVVYTCVKLHLRALIITPTDGLKIQWMNTYQKMFGFRESELCNISGSGIIQAIVNDQLKPTEAYFVNHQTLHSFLSQTNGYVFHQFFKKLNIGVKVYDESHMDFANILLTDFFSNTDRTWYLTATFDRSDKSESKCFKRAFQSVIPYGEEESKQIKRKHVVYHAVNVYSKITAHARAQLMAYPGYSSVKYGRYALFQDKSDTLYQTILSILKKTKDVEGKTIIFLPIIEGVDEVVRRLKIDFPEKSVTPYHSKMDKEEKEEGLLKKDIIVSTIKSCGTGKDIKGLRTVICAEPIASKVVTEQMIGRLREYAPDKDTYYWDIIDRAVPPNTWWYRSRMKKIETLVKEIHQFNM